MTKVTLFYADWCSHCTRFKPTWDALKKVFDSNNVEYSEYEESKDQKFVEASGVEGFPTIKIEKDNQEYEYNGKRDVNDILHEVLPNLQIGGNITKKYKIKYHQMV
tara:strand:- start:356 stop:673 length:318 start_codon:yes stop_codon:yes gene_type:complete